MTYKREFPFTKENYTFLKRFAVEQAGITLGDAKFEMLYSRLVKRLRVLKLKNFDEYCRLLRSQNADETREFINAITIHVSYFFREPHHFEYLANEYLPALLKDKTHKHKLRILSAGCATGVEPYSIAITLKESLPDLASWDIKIIAVDINTEILEKAKFGLYSEDEQKNLSPERLARWFYHDASMPKGSMKIKDEVKKLVEFKPLNLASNYWSLHDDFDIIFCRNVIIYFDQELQRKIFEKFANHLVADGILIIGYSEILYKITNRFHNMGRNIYKKIAAR